jgi:hypothetical protein
MISIFSLVIKLIQNKALNKLAHNYFLFYDESLLTSD